MGLAKGGHAFNDSDSEKYDSDEEDTNLKPSDALCLVASTEDDFSTLEVYCYETKTGSLYVHHDITLPAFPLALAWGDLSCNNEAGSYVAVGTFNSGVEVWNLDVLDPLEPSFVLGGVDNSAKEAAVLKQVESNTKNGKKSKKAAWGLEAEEKLYEGIMRMRLCVWTGIKYIDKF